MSRVLIHNKSLFLPCLLVLGVLLLLPSGSDVALAKKPPKPTPTPAPEPDHDPDLAYSAVRRVKGRNCSSIYTIKLDGSHNELFVDCGGYRCTAEEWSPDGSMLAFSTNEDVFEGPGIYVINVDGTGLRRIVAHGFSPTWSRGPYHGDGTWIAYTNQLVEPRAIYVVKVQQPGEDMNTPLPLVVSGPNEDPLLLSSWSADGQFLIVTAAVYDPFGWRYEIVYGFDPQSEIPTVLSEMNVNPVVSPPDCPLYGPKFSPVSGDNRILIAGCNQTYLVYFDGEDPLHNPGHVVYPHLSEFITDHNVDDPDWSPDATHFTFNARTSHASWGIFTMPLDPYAVPVEIVSGHGNGVVYKPKWRSKSD
jgi:Tol biopolymer transport system component